MNLPIDSTTNESDYSLFSISQAAHACNLSRSSLIRLEEKGLLTPARTDAKSGYRYYDNNNITRILQIRKLQRMGFSPDEIIFYYMSGGKADRLLAALEHKLSDLQQHIEEIRLRAHDVPDMSMSILKMPETLCCVRKYEGALIQDKYYASYDFFHKCVERGIALAPKPFFFISERTDYLEGKITSTPFDFSICIPVLPEQAPEEAVSIPACTALSLLVYGSNKLNEAYLHLGELVRKHGLTPAGYVRSISLVAAYVGKEIDPDRYCSQLVLPIEDEGDIRL